MKKRKKKNWRGDEGGSRERREDDEKGIKKLKDLKADGCL